MQKISNSGNNSLHCKTSGFVTVLSRFFAMVLELYKLSVITIVKIRSRVKLQVFVKAFVTSCECVLTAVFQLLTLYLSKVSFKLSQSVPGSTHALVQCLLPN